MGAGLSCLCVGDADWSMTWEQNDEIRELEHK